MSAMYLKWEFVMGERGLKVCDVLLGESVKML